jgi:integrase
MACVRKRRGRWVVDYRDAWNRRRWITCQSKREADILCAEKQRERREGAGRPTVDPDITIDKYADRWLQFIRATVKPRTAASYRQMVDLHILPTLGDIKIRQLQKGRIKNLLAEKLNRGLSRNSVRIIHATLRAMLNAAADDGVIAANPAAKLGRQLRLVVPAETRQEQIKALTKNQLSAFFQAAAQSTPRYHPLFLTLALTGMRLGEALGLQWDDLQLDAGEIRIARAISNGDVQLPKAGHGRSVDLPEYLARLLQRARLLRTAEKLKKGWPEMPPWVFCNEVGGLFDPSRVRKAFRRSLRTAGLPLHFHPHCLRHTYASLLLQQGESAVYVQRQLGHSSIKLTVDTYGKWLPLGNRAAVNRLAEAVAPLGSKAVAKSKSGTPDESEVPDCVGGPSRTRTLDPLIKSQLLYQLS